MADELKAGHDSDNAQEEPPAPSGMVGEHGDQGQYTASCDRCRYSFYGASVLLIAFRFRLT
jgi:hypothetical protein